jgi:hypothetical protein
MKTAIRVFLVLVFIAIVGILSFVIYRSYNYLEADQYSAENVIPPDALFVVKSKKTNDITNNNDLLSLLFSPENGDKIKSLLTEIGQSGNQKLMNHSSFYLSVHSENEKDILLILETSKEHNKSLISFQKQLQEKHSEREFDYKNQTIKLFEINGKPFYMWNLQGLLLFASSESLMRLVVNQFTENKVSSSVMDFSFHEKNRNTHLSIYVQYQYFLPYLQKNIRQAGGDQNIVSLLEPYRWSVFDVEMKNKYVLLSGYTQMNNNSQYAPLFSHSNNTMDFLKILPVNANRIFSFSVENSDEINSIKSIVNLSEDVFSLMYADRIITFTIYQDSNSFPYLAIHSENIDEASFYLYNSLESSFKDNHYLLDTFFIGSSMIGHINLSNFLLTKFGINQQLPHLAYYTLNDDFIIFSNSKEGICHYINSMRNHNIFTKSSTYKSIQPLSSDKANMFYYTDFDSLPKEDNLHHFNNLKALQFATYMQSDSVFLSNIVFQLSE